jgi:hypothetical protein
MPDLPTQRFVLYGDQHERSDADTPQLEALTKTLIKHDQESDEKIHILIEEPAGQTFYPAVLSDLRKRLQGCRTITAENIEMRCATGAACTLLAPDTVPSRLLESYTYGSAYTACGLGYLTMGDVEKEISSYKSATDGWLQALPAQRAKAVRVWEPELQADSDRFQTLYQRLELAPTDNVLELSARLYEQNPVQRKSLHKAIHNLASVLFDLHISKYILTPHDAKTVILVAGAWHTTRTYGLLDRIGNKVTRYGKDSEQPVQPLRPDDLNPNYEPSCFSSLCATQ